MTYRKARNVCIAASVVFGLASTVFVVVFMWLRVHNGDNDLANSAAAMTAFLGYVCSGAAAIAAIGLNDVARKRES